MSLDIKKLLFSRLTPFVLLVTMIISILVISMVKHQKISLQRQTIRIEITGKDWTNNYSLTEGYRAPYWLIEKLEKGIVELSPDGKIIAELLNIEYYERHGGSLQVFLDLEIETVDSFSSGKTIYKGKNIQIGETIEFNLNNTKILGQVTDINDINYQREKEYVIVQGIYRNVPNSLAQKVEVGLQSINPINGNVYSEIINKNVFQSTDKVFYEYPSEGIVHFRTDYSRRDIVLEVRLQVEKHLGQYFYSGNQIVKPGNNLALFFPTVNLKLMEITDVSEITTVQE